ncbi:hypothetical protein CA54_34190 [Symmachiella macrocystis]|uniref:Putative restriction endonuclease domain-containing protein n=2 Tax=Symmachiella macrocystis TaxID=2527985 RepID=A0A5C6BQN7_9PLAN|nr:hypothetical protein CA54_34190 [Symmachiella macrocystis]
MGSLIVYRCGPHLDLFRSRSQRIIGEETKEMLFFWEQAPMSHAVDSIAADWTAVDLAARYGAIPLSRIRLPHDSDPATEEDVVDIHDRENRLYELVDGVLLEKTMGTYESYIAMLLGQFLGDFIRQNNLGILLGADGILRLAPGLVRIPDVSFIARHKLPDGKVPRTLVATLVPDLAIEVISKGNTAEEMQEKLRDYFEVGVGLVWYVDHLRKQVRVYTAVDQEQIVGIEESLDGGDVLPGFTLPVSSIYAE